MSRKALAESATGVVENPHGLGKFYDDRDGSEIDHDKAHVLFNDGQTIAVPNAGAGSYHQVFNILGYEEVEDICLGASSGDWVFAIRDGDTWYLAFQNNRYPYHGYTYSRGELPFASFEDACNFAGC